MLLILLLYLLYHLKLSVVVISVKDLLSPEILRLETLSLIFLLIIQRTYRAMVEIAILKLGIQNKLRLNPLQLQGFADDIVLSSYDILVLHSMLGVSKPILLQAALKIKHRRIRPFMLVYLETTGTQVETMIY